MRKRSGSLRSRSQASITTEYRDSFPPRCHTTVRMSSRIKNPPKAPQSSLPPKERHQRYSGTPHDPSCPVVNQLASEEEDYTSVYRNDFRAWGTNKRRSFRVTDSLKVNQGLVFTNSDSKEGRTQGNSVHVYANSKPDPQEQNPQPFGSITSYRSDYITHPVQPRTRREKRENRTNKGLPSAPAASSRPKLAWHMNQEPFDGASEFFQQFKTWSLETKFHGQGKAKVSSPPADHKAFLSTTHRDYKPHRCQRTKPILPSVQSSEKSKDPFQTTTTMKEHFKAWDTPRHLTIIHKEEMEWPKKIPFLGCTPKPAESCKTNLKPFSVRPKLNETAVSNSSCIDTGRPQCPVENGAFSGFKCISNGTEESGIYWSTCLDKGATWPNGDICDDPSQPKQNN